MHIIIVIVIVILCSAAFIPSRNLDEVSLITIHGSNVHSKPLSC